MYSYGRPLVQFDLAAEARLRWKIDLFVVPTVALLYLFCFIDRANIGRRCTALFLVSALLTWIFYFHHLILNDL